MKSGVVDIPVCKNDEIEMSFTDLGDKGEGIGRYKGFTVMVPGALPGEIAMVRIVQVRTRFAFGKLIKLIHRSPDRIVPSCPLDGKCGGCQLGHLSYESQLSYKRDKVKQVLTRIGHFTEEEIEAKLAESTLGMKDHGQEGAAYFHYRNKAQFPVQIVDGKAEAGFYAPRSHRLLPTEDCRIQSEKANELIHEIMNCVRDLSLSVYDEESGRGLLRHVLIRTSEATGEISVCFVINGKTIPNLDRWKDFMRTHEVTSFALNINTANTNVILGTQTVAVFGSMEIRDIIDGLTFRISPPAFYQVNARQMQVLYRKVLEFADLSGSETVWDAYCGIGTISLFLSRKAGHVYAVEIVPEAIENARVNAELNQITNVDFFVGKAEKVIPDLYENQGVSADVIVVDPPRAGCDEALLKTLRQMAPQKIVYVSCDPATLARDLDYLCHGSETDGATYTLAKAQTVDMFPNTSHVETVVQLSKGNISS